MKVAQLKNGTPVTLTPTGKGGAESEIFRLSPGILAAIPNEEMTADRVSVVEALAAMPPVPCVALPTELLYDCGKPIGWLMPEIKGEPLEVFFLPAERTRLGLDFNSQRFQIAKNLIQIFQSVQKADIAIVDNHPGNFILTTSRGNITAITRIDVAAGCGFTINHRPIPASAAAMPDYVPREAMPDFRSGAIHTWGVDQAAGALGAILFKVFTGGGPLDHGEHGAPADLIETGRVSIFTVEPNSEVRRQFDSLPPVIRSYLEQAITGPAGRRPTLDMWDMALQAISPPKPSGFNWSLVAEEIEETFGEAAKFIKQRKYACIATGAGISLGVMWLLGGASGSVTDIGTTTKVPSGHPPSTANSLWKTPEPIFYKPANYTPKVPTRLWRDPQ